jgi:transketolase
MALAAKKKMAGHKIFVLLSDGEMNEGSNWEALMAASHFRLNNLISIIDYNKLQSLASTEETMGLEPLVDKIAAFGWEVTCVDGHCHTELRDVFTKERVLPDTPHMIIANTIKGKGVSFMENKVLWHYAPPNDDELEIALEELRGSN